MNSEVKITDEENLLLGLCRLEFSDEQIIRIRDLVEIHHDLLTYASQAGMSEILAWHLEPLRDLWGVTFPGWIDDFIKGWYNPDSINKFIFFLKSPKNNPPLDKPSAYRHKISEIPGVHRKFLYLLGDLFPTVSFMKKRYHCTSKWKVLFYYPHRIGKVLWLLGR